jgi:hypothetical protein
MINEDYKDDPVQMLLDYQEIMGSISLLLKKLEQIDRFNESLVFDHIKTIIEDTIPDISGYALIGRKYDKMMNLIQKNNAIIETNCTENEFQLFISDTIKNGMVWNYETHVPNCIQKDQFYQHAHLISWMCELENDLNLYVYCVRQQNKQPFLSHEIDAITIFAKIAGSHLSKLYANHQLQNEISAILSAT